MASIFSNYMDKLDNSIGQNEVVDKYLSMIEKKTNVKKRYIALGKFVFPYGSLIILFSPENNQQIKKFFHV